MSKKTKPAQAGHNTKRTLDAVEVAWDKLDRDDVFARGALLIRVRELVKHGDWTSWLKARGWEEQSARRAMKASRLATKSAKLMDLDLPKTIIYELLIYADEDGKPEPELPSIIAALDTATKGATERLTARDLTNVIIRARQRFKYGDLPEATWDALDSIDEEETEWAKAASDELKKKRPKDEEEAGKIVFDFHHAHVAKLYAEHGVLPKMAYEGYTNHGALEDLENEIIVPLDRRARLLKRLLAEPQPLTPDQVDTIIRDDDDYWDAQGEQGEQGEQESPNPNPDPPRPDSPNIKDTVEQIKREALAGAKAQPGPKPNPKPKPEEEIKRLNAVVEELATKNTMFKGVIDGRDREIKDLKAEIEKLKVDPKGPAAKHAEALVIALKGKVSREKAQEVIEDICKKLGVDTRKLNPPDSRAAA